jgi:hypothetical protein
MTVVPKVRHEVEVDTKLAECYDREQTAQAYLSSAKKSLTYRLGLKEEPGLLFAIARAEERADEPQVAEALARVLKHREEIAEAKADAAPYAAEYAETRWSRFFLCNNTGGHIHSSLHCSTLRWDTSMSWLPELSGLTERDAVEEHGEILCSVCFPSAPVEWTSGVSKKTQAERDAKAAEKAERDAKKAEKAIFNPDGSPIYLELSYGVEVKTLVTARNELTRSMVELGTWSANTGHPNQAEFIERYSIAIQTLVAAIAHKTGESEESVRAEHEVKAAKKAAKDAKEAAKWAAELGLKEKV